MSNWPFPTQEPVPWTKKQEKQYQEQKRQQLPDSPL